MQHLSIFAPLAKADEASRTVYGTAVVEQPDRSGEIFDYNSSKPHFQKWSSDFSKATDGKSLGNVRSMHANLVVGKLVDIGFDDERKAIDVAAKIVDDNEWKKVDAGLYTGFSIGGKYLKRWDDGGLKRYTAAPGEISLVDLPCVPGAKFSMVKVDGLLLTKSFRVSSIPELPARAYRDIPIVLAKRDISVAALRKLAEHTEFARTFPRFRGI
jgi:hypothetical protein